jgi:hypothetical protein
MAGKGLFTCYCGTLLRAGGYYYIMACVLFGECTIWRMYHLANEPFGKCTIWLLHKNKIKKTVFGPFLTPILGLYNLIILQTALMNLTIALIGLLSLKSNLPA